jgi:hypothetical protein
MKSGNLKLLEPSGSLQAYNGTALPLPLPVYVLAMYFISILNVKSHLFILSKPDMKVAKY